MNRLALIFFALPLFAQTPSSVYCKVSLLNSVSMKGFYGGRAGMFQANMNCLNMGSNPAPIAAVMLDLSMPTINTIPSSQAATLLTKTYNHQPGQEAAKDLTIGVGVLGVLEAAGGRVAAFLAAGPFGLVVASAMTVINYVIPFFTANEPPLSFTNQCDQVQTGTMLAPGAALTCTVYIQKPPKTSPALPGAFTFYLLGGAVNPVPSPLPPVPPVQLKPNGIGYEVKPNGMRVCTQICPDELLVVPNSGLMDLSLSREKTLALNQELKKNMKKSTYDIRLFKIMAARDAGELAGLEYDATH